MLDQGQLQRTFETALMLIGNGKINDAVRLITKEQVLIEQIQLLRWLNNTTIELVQQTCGYLASARERALDRAPALDFSLARDFILARDIARAHARARSLTLDLDFASAYARARTLVHAFVHVRRALVLDFGFTDPLILDFASAYARARTLVRALVHVRRALVLDFGFIDAAADVHDLDLALDRIHRLDMALDHILEDARALDSILLSAANHAASHLSTGVNTKSAEVVFSAFYPPQVKTKTSASLVVYSHVSTALMLVEQDVGQAEKIPADEGLNRNTITRQADLEPGTLVTIVPECDDLEFQPTVLTKRWEPDWVRYEFAFQAGKEIVSTTAIVNISIQVAGVEIANIKRCAIDVVKKTAKGSGGKRAIRRLESTLESSQNNLGNINMTVGYRLVRQTATGYQKIYISYSREDVEVVHAYKAAREAIGHDRFVDTDSIHTADDWMVRLATEIDKADIFQLFWSEKSAASVSVREEWQYALLHRCPEDRCVGFIRLVNWKRENPTLEPAKELAHLQFHRAILGDSLGTGLCTSGGITE